MSKVSDLIFHKEKHYITSKFGKRSAINTSGGVTSTFHSGTDYGTTGKKLAQYAIDIGTVISCGKASDGAKYVWVEYPRQGVKMLHYHLDSIKVKARQSVNKDTLLGYTGKTGKATGVHLHLVNIELNNGELEFLSIINKNKSNLLEQDNSFNMHSTFLRLRILWLDFLLFNRLHFNRLLFNRSTLFNK